MHHLLFVPLIIIFILAIAHVQYSYTSTLHPIQINIWRSMIKGGRRVIPLHFMFHVGSIGTHHVREVQHVRSMKQ